MVKATPTRPKRGPQRRNDRAIKIVFAGFFWLLLFLGRTMAMKEERRDYEAERREAAQNTFESSWLMSDYLCTAEARKRGHNNFMDYYLDKSDERWMKFFRIPKPLFLLLVSEYKQAMPKRKRCNTRALSHRERMGLALMYLGKRSGESHWVSNDTGKSRATILECVDQVCHFLVEHKLTNVITKPDAAERKTISEWFLRNRGGVGCLGGIDGKHFATTAGADQNLLYRCYKGYRSLSLLAWADNHYRFRWVSAIFPGSMSDGRIASQSEFFRSIYAKSYLDDEKPFTVHGQEIPYWIAIDGTTFVVHSHYSTHTVAAHYFLSQMRLVPMQVW